jgi:hypothetical protein
MIGDGAISTSSEIVSTFSLPGPFSHVCKAIIPATCVVNVGLCKRLFGDGECLRSERITLVRIRSAPSGSDPPRLWAAALGKDAQHIIGGRTPHDHHSEDSATRRADRDAWHCCVGLCDPARVRRPPKHSTGLCSSCRVPRHPSTGTMPAFRPRRLSENNPAHRRSLPCAMMR